MIEKGSYEHEWFELGFVVKWSDAVRAYEIRRRRSFEIELQSAGMSPGGEILAIVKTIQDVCKWIEENKNDVQAVACEKTGSYPC
jgi:hypothetical protein